MEIFFITGLMGAGKSRMLIEDYNSNIENKIAFAANLVEKTGTRGQIVSRNGWEISSYNLYNQDTPENIVKKIDELIPENKTTYVYIDESQFLSKQQVIKIIEMLNKKDGIVIYFYGLDLTFQDVYFESAKYLIDLLDSDEIYLLMKPCDRPRCLRVARHNARIVNGKVAKSGDVFLEEKSEYLAVCDKHFLED